jgi:DNA-directed RNA polymerase subunit M/transcription elongation factor TFIIS
MYYLKIQDEDGNIGNTLIYYCRNCGHEDTTLSTNNICVSDMQLLSSEKKYTHIVNEYTKFDPTLPRINTIKCPNQDCVSNGGVQSMSGGGGKRKTEEEKQAAAESKKAATEEKKREKEAIASAKKSASQAKKSAAEAQATLAVVKANLETLIEEEEQQEQHEQAEQHTEHHNNREVIYIRYDDTNMKYVYLCAHCDTTWRTDNRL